MFQVEKAGAYAQILKSEDNSTVRLQNRSNCAVAKKKEQGAKRCTREFGSSSKCPPTHADLESKC
jgi:hypothetical protein